MEYLIRLHTLDYLDGSSMQTATDVSITRRNDKIVIFVVEDIAWNWKTGRVGRMLLKHRTAEEWLI